MTFFRTSLLRKPKTTRDAINRATATLAVIDATIEAQAENASRVMSRLLQDCQTEAPTLATVRQVKKALLTVRKHHVDISVQLKGVAKNARTWELIAAEASEKNRSDLYQQASKHAPEMRRNYELLEIERIECEKLMSAYEQLIDKM